MGVLKVGDKLEVMVDKVGSTTELKGNILTVTKADGFDSFNPTHFMADYSNGTCGWFFTLDHITNNELKLLPTAQSNHFKIGDIIEFRHGVQWKITDDLVTNWKVELVNDTVITLKIGLKIGDKSITEKIYTSANAKLISSNN